VKVLLDEHFDHRLRMLLGSHEVFTVAYLGWSGLKNGSLLTKAEVERFDVLLTGDQTLVGEQNLNGRRIAIVIVTVIELRLLRDSLPAVIEAIDQSAPGSVRIVDCGSFRRSDRPTPPTHRAD